MIYAYPNQSYEEHIVEMLKCWDKIREKYQKTLVRILKAEKVDFLVKAMIILHDSGKGTEFYQEAISQNKGLERYRHEIVSSYLAYKLLDNRVQEPHLSVISAALLLHHEPILMGCIGTQRERGITLTDIRGRVEYPRGGYEAEYKTKKLHSGFKETFENLFRKYLNFECDINLNEIEIDDLIRVIGRIISLTSLSGDDSWRQQMRSMVALLLHILVVCDYYGARGRGGDEPKFRREIEWEWGGSP